MTDPDDATVIPIDRHRRKRPARRPAGPNGTVTLRITEPIPATRAATLATREVLQACDPYWVRTGPGAGNVQTFDGVTRVVIITAGWADVSDAIDAASVNAGPGWSVTVT